MSNERNAGRSPTRARTRSPYSCGAQPLQLVPGDRVEPQLARRVDVRRAVERAAHAGLHRRVRVDQPLLDRALEHGAMEVAGAVVRLPDVGVRVEVDERQRAVHGRRRAQLAQHHRVVAAQAERRHAGGVHGRQEVLDPAQRLLVVAGHGRRVAVVDHREALGHVDAEERVVRSQQGRGAADRLRAEPRAGLVRDGVVGGDADHRDVHILRCLHGRQPHERAGAGEAGRVRGESAGP